MCFLNSIQILLYLKATQFLLLLNVLKEKECPIKFITDENGVLLIDEKEVMSRWMRYFKSLSSDEAENDIIAE